MLERVTKTRTLPHEEIFEIKDLKMLTAKRNILKAPERECQNCDALTETVIRLVRMSYDDTQVTVI